ncbi:hypothetical protein Slin15195_G129950 [Septoria linicola]|uniref:Uncharacterized protein n=1 Tax=Septoria linicola TaxID=215465 RepID=A0A9Q9B9T4_9PEZI|nr:hypothetical protein Slin14017_G128970 [Septoria linicola]USW59676.1 hypothetical protein Slin15195_G129950 [Septoria linicola]
MPPYLTYVSLTPNTGNDHRTRRLWQTLGLCCVHTKRKATFCQPRRAVRWTNQVSLYRLFIRRAYGKGEGDLLCGQGGQYEDGEEQLLHDEGAEDSTTTMTILDNKNEKELLLPDEH